MARFRKGQSGNPGGRPKDLSGFRELARAYGTDALRALLAVMRSRKSPAAARVSAAVAILDRAYGKPVQSVGLDVRPTLEEIVSAANRIGNDEGGK